MSKINVYYISIEGNTRHFLTKMNELFHNLNLHEITDQSDDIEFKAPYFCFIPTYVKGVQFNSKYKADSSNFQGNQITEMDTLTMNEELGYKDNAKHCLGLIASGNRNFGVDCYCWTGRMYHKKYHIPLIADYELMGNMKDEQHINHLMVKIWNKMTGSHLPLKDVSNKSPELKRLEKKFGKVEGLK